MRTVPTSARPRRYTPRSMKIAHVRELHAPAGAPWRLAAGARRPPASVSTGRTSSWLAVGPSPADPNLAHDSVLHRQPVTTLDDHLARGLRVESLAELVDVVRRRGADRTKTTPCLKPPSSFRPADPPAAVAPRLLRVRGPRQDDVGTARRRGARGLVPPADLLLQQRLGDPRAGRAGLGAGGDPASSTTSSRSRRSSTRRRATSPRSGPRRRSAATRSSTTGPPGTSSARRRPSGWGRRRARTSPRRSGRGS